MAQWIIFSLNSIDANRFEYALDCIYLPQVEEGSTQPVDWNNTN